MPTNLRPTGRRRRRALRVVGSSHHLLPGWAVDEALTYRLGIQTLAHTRTLFPDWYEQHLHARRVTRGALLGAAEAFLVLVDHKLFPLEPRWGWHLHATPEAALTRYVGNSHEWLVQLAELEYDLRQPCPVLWGFGASVVITGEDELARETSALTCALWHIFAPTTWGLDADMAELVRTHELVRPLQDYILQLPQLDATTDIPALRQALNTHRGRDANLGDLVAYAHGATGNAYADVSNIEIDLVYGGQTDFAWEDARDMQAPLSAARALADQFHQLARRVHQAPEQELAALIQRLTTVVGSIPQAAMQSPQPLVEALDLSSVDWGDNPIPCLGVDREACA